MNTVKVILREKVNGLGNIGDQVLVKPGYARNFLLSHGKAVLATTEHVAEFEKYRADLEKLLTEQIERAKVRAKELEGKTFRILAKSGNEGKLFGSVGPREISEAIVSRGFSIEKHEIILPEGPIRQIGEYEIKIRLHTTISTTVEIVISSDE
ncbi:50S ribosomal protein L9 [Coxiella endosymbiont of Amblyomma sculptum]|uniref:50S ribosomal protein L9 n=1 Tax=Coxiella endosymbiont of Amblyomma sculptum TaxID=2487929 RepID=UPI00132E77EC|nr:50S ribosomal protein L9 [Coxiella endosymbiont of Amblyomma sculptum]QHG92552.1 50S ribosomal protein L9 [Coxiella endosymbiont of Amblyomma sculptum]